MNAPARNDPCPCGSGLKYKKCCMSRAPAAAPAPSFDALLRGAVQLQSAGRAAEAETAYRELLRMRPRHGETLHRLALLCHAQRRFEEAATLLETAVAADRRNASHHGDLGVMYDALGRDEEAMASLRRALELNPEAPDPYVNLGRLHFRRREYAEAESCYRRALALRPGFPIALLNLGLACHQLRRDDEAVQHYQRALVLQPDFTEAHYNLGCAYEVRGERDEAVASYRRALALRPHYSDARIGLGAMLLHNGAHEEARRHLDEALRLGLSSATAHSIVLMTRNYGGAAPEEMLALHRDFARHYETPLRERWPRHAIVRMPAQRLKIGYVSPDLRRHSVAYFIEPLLEHHDRAAVEVYCYYSGGFEDDVSLRLAGLSDHWLACGGWNDDRLARRIMDDGIDVLVDLAGHTQDNRLELFARKPAPVQASWLGYPATTGLDAMDWRIVTADTDPAGEERWHSERLYRLPRSLWCYRPRADQRAARVRAPMLDRGGEAWFGSMNNLAKVSPETVATWARIMDAVPGSRLTLTGVHEGETRKLLAQRFAALGIAPERLLMNGRLNDAEYSALFDQIDIALDPFPYNGTTTTCETLWRGVPVVSLEGERSVERSGHALLKLLGLESLVAKDREGYVDLAVALARDPDRITALRGELRPRFEASPLRDEAGFAREMEQAYREMHETTGTGPL